MRCVGSTPLRCTQFDHAFTDRAPEVEEGTGIRGAHHDPHPDHPADRIGHLQDTAPSVPQIAF